MLSTWYFCCCTEMAPTQMSTYLAIRAALRTANTADLVEAAWKELARCEPIALIHALPDVLRSLRENAPGSTRRGVCAPYLERIRDLLPEDKQEVLAPLLSTARERSSRLGKLAVAAATLILNSDHEEERTPEPYLDTKDFLPEVLLLSVLVEAAERDPSMASEIEARLTESELKGVLDGALDHDYGRLPFLLALRLRLCLGTAEPLDGLALRMWDEASENPPFEPDLIEAFLARQRAELAQGEEEVLRQLVERLMTFDGITRLRAKAPRAKRSAPPSIRKAGLDPKGPRVRALPYVYWQILCWEAIGTQERGPEHVAEFWQPPWGGWPRFVALRLPRPTQLTKHALLELVGLRNYDPELVRPCRTGETSMYPPSRRLVHSPWLGWHRRPDPNEAPSDLELLRLMGALPVASQLLAHRSLEPATRDELAALLIHGAHRLGDYRRWFQYPTPRQKDDRKKLSFPLTGLARHVDQSIQRVALGVEGKLEPADFLRLRTHWERFVDEEPTSSLRGFRSRELPPALMDWIEEALPAADGRDRGPSRWLGSVDEVARIWLQSVEVQRGRKIKKGRKGGKVSKSDMRRLSLVRIFARGRLPEWVPDWRSSSSKAGWKIHFREILLSPALAPEEWHRREWKEPSKGGPTELVRAIERVSADARAPLDEERQRVWRHDLLVALSGIKERRDLDRRVRLRLLELYEDPEIRDATQLRVALVHVLVEFGGMLELSRLTEGAMEEIGREGARHDLIDRRETLIAFLVALDFTIAARREELAKEAHREPREPWHELRDRAELELVEDLLLRLLFALREAGGHSWKLLLRLRLARARRLLRVPEHSLLGGDVLREESGRDPVLAVDRAQPRDRIFHPIAAAARRQDDSAAWFFETFELGHDRGQPPMDLREASSSELQDLREGEGSRRIYAIGNVIGSGKKGLAIDCGVGQNMRATKLDLGQRGSLSPGEPVLAPIFWRRSAPSSWLVSNKYPTRPLRPHGGASRVRKFIVEQATDERRGYLVMSLRAGTKELPRRSYERNIERWHADPSAAFGDAGTRSYEVLVQEGSDGPLPLDRGLLDLLLEHESGVETMVLTLLDAYAGSEEEPSVRLQLRPGVVFLIQRREFRPDDAEELWERIASAQSVVGLLVVLKWASEDGQVRLALAREPHSAHMRSYPELRAPFDDRNLQWLGLFTDPEGESEAVEVARRSEAGRWTIDLGDRSPVGFPDRLEVQWKGERETQPRGRPPRQEELSDVEILRWDLPQALRAEVWVEPLRESTASPCRGDWEGFGARWLAPGRGMMLGAPEEGTGLKRVARRGAMNDGYVRAWTAENIGLLVEAESFSMRGMSEGATLAISSRSERPVIVTYCKSLPPKPFRLVEGGAPPRTFEPGCAHGLLIGAPRTASASVARILWIDERGCCEPQTVELADREGLRWLEVGDLVEGRLHHGAWEFRIVRRILRARALWKDISGHPERSDSLIGVDVRRRGRSLFECDEGSFKVAEEHALREQRLNDGLEEGVQVRDISPPRSTSWPEGRRWIRRAGLRRKGKLFWGRAVESAPNGEVLLHSTTLQVDKLDHGLWDLRREFRLIERPRSALPLRSEREATSARRRARDQRHREAWERYLGAPFDIECEIKRGDVLLRDLRVPVDDGWSEHLTLAEGEGPFIWWGKYSGDKAFCRLVGDGPYFATLRGVPPLSIESYLEFLEEELGQPIEFGESIELKRQLFFVGWEKPDPVEEGEGGAETEQLVRFELGYGRTICAPPRRVRLQHQALDPENTLLFHGDAITRLVFREFEGELSIEIRKYDLQISEATSLYRQATNGLIHVLHVRRAGGAMVVDHVEGLAAANLKEALKPYRQVRAALDEESRARLARRSADDFENATITILGRLDRGLFRRSLGHKVEFAHVGMSFKPGPFAPLRERDIVLVRGGRIKRKTNDTILQVRPLAGLDPRDIGSDVPDMEGLGVLRRSFSARESALPTLLEERGSEAQLDRPLLVYVSPSRDGKRIDAALLMRKRVPRLIRQRKAFFSLLRIRHAAMATVLTLSTEEHSQRQMLYLELRPSVFVRVPLEKIEALPEGLEWGTVVRITLGASDEPDEETLRLEVAVRSDLSYVDRRGRPVVVLPKNELLRKGAPGRGWEQNTWRSAVLTVGGLPDLEPRLGHHANGRWLDPDPDELTELMEERHPKLGFLARDHDGRLRLAPAGKESCVGRLEILEDELRLRFRSNLRHETEETQKELLWYQNTFADEPIQVAQDRALRARWYYHDRKTGYWSEEGVCPQKVKCGEVRKGPLFFEHEPGYSPRLRYPRADLRSFGFPMRELVDLLSRRSEHRGRPSLWLPVAGLSEGSIWIELAPGRISELPLHALRWRGGRYTRALDELDLRMFSQGDSLRIKKADHDPLAPPLLEIDGWKAGPRGAFGRESVFLPVRGHDAGSGALELGVGIWRLTLPVRTRPDHDFLELDRDNELHEAQDEPQRDDVVLLAPTEEGVEVLGYPELVPWPDRKGGTWKRDPLAPLLLRRSERGPSPRLRLSDFKEIAGLCGGALPVTVEGVDRRGNLYFSRRLQLPSHDFLDERFGLAQVLGYLEVPNMVLVRVGWSLYLMDVCELVMGLPPALRRPVMRELAALDLHLPVRRGEAGILIAGVEPGRAQSELKVHVVAHFPSKRGEAPLQRRSGFVCRSLATHQLHWMEEKHASWCRLPSAMIQELLIEEERPLRVRRSERGAVSVVHRKEALAEFRQMRVGHALFVRALWPEEDGGYIAESTRSRVMLRVHDPSDTSLDLDPRAAAIRVEVAERFLEPRCLLIAEPPGARPPPLDLPSWMLGDLPEPGKLRGAFSEQLQWISEGPGSQEPPEPPLPEELTEVELDELVCRHIGPDPTAVTETNVLVSQTWIDRRPAKELPLLPALLAMHALGRAANVKAHEIAAVLSPGLGDVRELREEWQGLVRKLLDELGRRALRSLHVETLARDWYGRPERRRERSGLRHRLERLLRRAGVEKGELTMASIAAFRRAVELHDDEGLRPIADALAAAEGNLKDPRRLRERAEILRELAGLYRPVANPIRGATPEELALLGRAIATVKAHPLDIVLLEPAPRILWEEAE